MLYCITTVAWLKSNKCVPTLSRPGLTAVLVQGNISRVADISAVFETALKEFNKIDIVVVNAGVEIVGKSTLEVTESDFDAVFSVNAKGTFFTLKNAALHVEDGGRIIYIGSSTSKFPMPGHAVYGANKIAPCYVVEVLAKELGSRGVTVNSVLPSATQGAGVSTDGIRPAAQAYLDHYNPMGRAASLDDVANSVAFLASEDASYISGQHILLSGGAPA
jgi:3-oxoacyl-[acyl-carrier protein] reductase